MLTALRNLFRRTKKSVIEVTLTPASGDGSACIEAWVFPMDPSADPPRHLNFLSHSTLVDKSWILGDSAYFEDRWSAQTQGMLTPGGRTSPPPAWSMDQANQEVEVILRNAPPQMDVWVLEHTSTTAGVRAHHATGVIELPFDIPANVDTCGPMEAARKWLLEHKRSFLSARPPEHPLRQAIPQGADAVIEAVQRIEWSPEEVEQAASTLIYMAQPPYSRTDPQLIKLWTSGRSEKEDWLRSTGGFADFFEEITPSQWVPNQEFESAFGAVCQAIPSGLMTQENFDQIAKKLPINRLPYFWLVHRPAEHFWEYAEKFWAHLTHQWKTDKQYNRVVDFKGLISFTERPIEQYGEHWAFEVFARLPRPMQITALEEALDDMIERASRIFRWDPSNNLHLLEPQVPDWPYWDLIKEGLQDPAACRLIRSVMRQNQLQELLPSSESPVQAKRF